MEDVMNGPRQRKLELVCHRGDLFDDLEGSVSFGHQLRHLMREFQILPL
jgi:hypothetical protein